MKILTEILLFSTRLLPAVLDWSIQDRSLGGGLPFTLQIAITWCVLIKIMEANKEEGNPPKKRRLSILPHNYKRIKAKLNLEGKALYLIRAPAEVSPAACTWLVMMCCSLI